MSSTAALPTLPSQMSNISLAKKLPDGTAQPDNRPKAAGNTDGVIIHEADDEQDTVKRTYYLEKIGTKADVTELGNNDLVQGVLDLEEEDEDEEYMYEEVPLDEFEHGSDEEDPEETLEDAVRHIHEKNFIGVPIESSSKQETEATVTLEKRPEVVDDFIRNYLNNKGMLKSLESFQNEWYEFLQTGKLSEEDVKFVPDVYQRNQELEEAVSRLRKEVQGYRDVANKARATYDRLRKERDFHRMHHKRVVQEKNKLVSDIKRLKKHYDSYEPTLKQLQHKYELALKEKMLTKLEKDRLVAKVTSTETSIKQLEKSLKEVGITKSTRQSKVSDKSGPSTPSSADKKNAKRKENTSGPGALANKDGKESALPSEDRANPFLDMDLPTAKMDRFKQVHMVKGHNLAVSSLKFHPKKMILASASDDRTWKMWAFPSGEVVMSGEGHKDWIADCDFHPKGAHLATASGDSTVKIWDFAKGQATMTLSDHTQGVWSCAFHDLGDFLATSSLDHTTKLWDIHTGKCRQTFRGHADSVNQVVWQPFSNSLVTCSGDKTVSLWDARSGLCSATLYGHMNAVNCVAFSLRGNQLASCDADGIIKFWDLRNVSEIETMDAGPHTANKLSFDPSGNILAVASDDGTGKLFNLQDRTRLPPHATVPGFSNFRCRELTGHEEAVQCVLFDRTGEFMVTGGSDGTFRIWN